MTDESGEAAKRPGGDSGQSPHSSHDGRLLRSAEEDARAAVVTARAPQTQSRAYRLAYADIDFLLRDELRPVRLQLELLKPDLLQTEHGIDATVVIFGGTRILDPETARRRLERAEARAGAPTGSAEAVRQVEAAKRALARSRYYDAARRLGFLIASRSSEDCGRKLVVTTGGGPGIMEAANRGAADAGAETIGLNIVLPHEQAPNPYVTPKFSFQFHYFAIRKMHFLMRARALVVFPGGFGTLDELFETLTLIQTRKVTPFPVLLFGREYWDRVLDFDVLAEEGAIAPEDMELFRFVETAEEAWALISEAASQPDSEPANRQL